MKYLNTNLNMSQGKITRTAKVSDNLLAMFLPSFETWREAFVMVFNKGIVAPINVAELTQDSGQKCGQKCSFQTG